METSGINALQVSSERPKQVNTSVHKICAGTGHRVTISSKNPRAQEVPKNCLFTFFHFSKLKISNNLELFLMKFLKLRIPGAILHEIYL